MEKTLNQYCELIVDCEHKSAPISDEGCPSIRTTDIDRGLLNLEIANRVGDETYEAWTKREKPLPGDLILAREAPVGGVGVIPKNAQVCLGQRTVLIRPDLSKVHNYYLLYLLLSPRYQHRLNALSNGATVAHLNMKDIRELKIHSLPDNLTQKKIGSIVYSIDKKINCNRKKECILKELLNLLYIKWFVNYKFPGYKNYQFKESEVGEKPEGWNIEYLHKHVGFIKGNEPGSDNYFDEPDYGLIPFIRVGDLGSRSAQIFVSEDLAKGKILKEEDIALTLDGSVGLVSTSMAGAYSGGIRKIKIKKSSYLKRAYVFELLKSYRIQKIIDAYAIGTTILHASAATKKITFVLPPKDIIDRFESIAEPILNKLLHLEKINKKLDQEKENLIEIFYSPYFNMAHLENVNIEVKL